MFFESLKGLHIRGKPYGPRLQGVRMKIIMVRLRETTWGDLWPQGHRVPFLVRRKNMAPNHGVDFILGKNPTDVWSQDGKKKILWPQGHRVPSLVQRNTISLESLGDLHTRIKPYGTIWPQIHKMYISFFIKHIARATYGLRAIRCLFWPPLRV